MDIRWGEKSSILSIGLAKGDKLILKATKAQWASYSWSEPRSENHSGLATRPKISDRDLVSSCPLTDDINTLIWFYLKLAQKDFQVEM